MNKNVVQEIRKATRRKFTAEEKIRIVLEGLGGEIPVTELSRREALWMDKEAKTRLCRRDDCRGPCCRIAPTRGGLRGVNFCSRAAGRGLFVLLPVLDTNQENAK